jgi:hypothetical protein
MQRGLPLPGSLYLEACGRIVFRGRVERVDPAIRSLMDTWCAHRQGGDPARLQALTYPGEALHSPETVNLCRWLATSSPASSVALIYAHRGHQVQCKTPLFQSLLAKLPPGLQVHGLRVEEDHLPLEIVLFAVAALRYRDRCIIIKDNAIRLGTTDVVSVNSTQYLVLSRSPGPWAIDDILLTDDNLALPARVPVLPLDAFSTGTRNARRLSLVSRVTNGRLGIINIHKQGP